MKKKRVGMVAGIAILVLAVLLTSGIAQGRRQYSKDLGYSPQGQYHYPQIPGIPIGAYRIDLDFNQLDEGHDAIRAFIATGSTSPVILGTLNECNYAFSIRPLFCSPRDYNGEHGIVVSIFMTEWVDVDFGAGVTLYQQGARYYSAPVFYPGD